MTTDTPDQPTIRLPAVTLKDLIGAVSIVVAITTAWGLFSTRITLLERDMTVIKSTLAQHDAAYVDLAKAIARVQDQQIQHDIFIDQLYDATGKIAPKRRGAGDAR